MTSGNAIVMVDAGFLIKALVTYAGRTSRSEVAIDYEALAEALIDLAEDATNRQVLRQTWYDGARGARPRAEHSALAAVPGVHVRLGWTIETSSGLQQKAVDTLMVRDMVLAALRDTANDLVLVAGDGDLVPGVQEAAEHGMRIHLWGVSGAGPRFGQSEQLIALADRRVTLDLADLAPYVRDRREAQPSDTPRLESPIEEAARPSVAADQIVMGPVFEPPADVASADLTTEANVLSSPHPLAERATFVPPPLRSLSTPEQEEQDLADDLATTVDATALGEKYGERWWSRASHDVRARLLVAARRPGLPRRLDSDLLRYAQERGISPWDDEQFRRDLRTGFWTGFDRIQGNEPMHPVG